MAQLHSFSLDGEAPAPSQGRGQPELLHLPRVLVQDICHENDTYDTVLCVHHRDKVGSDLRKKLQSLLHVFVFSHGPADDSQVGGHQDRLQHATVVQRPVEILDTDNPCEPSVRSHYRKRGLGRSQGFRENRWKRGILVEGSVFPPKHALDSQAPKNALFAPLPQGNPLPLELLGVDGLLLQGRSHNRRENARHHQREHDLIVPGQLEHDDDPRQGSMGGGCYHRSHSHQRIGSRSTVGEGRPLSHHHAQRTPQCRTHKQ